MVAVSDNRVAVNSPYLKCEAKLSELIKIEMANRNSFLAGFVRVLPGQIDFGVGFMVLVFGEW